MSAADVDEAPTWYGARREKVRAELAGRPPYLSNVWEKFADRLERKPLAFVELHGAQGLSPSDLRRLEPRLVARRQAIALVAGVLLTEMDIASMCAARRRSDGAYSGIGHEAIAERSGLALRRVGRVIADLVAAGYLTAHQPIEPYLKADGTVGYCAHRTIYRFTELFFQRSHYDQRLKRERARAAERRSNRVRVYAASLLRARRAWRAMKDFGAAEYLPRTAGPPVRRRPPPRRS